MFSHSIEKARRGTFLCCVSEKIRYRWSLLIRGGGEYKDFPSKKCCLTVLKKLVGEPFCAVFQKNSGWEKFMDTGDIKVFRRKVFVSQCRKFS